MAALSMSAPLQYGTDVKIQPAGVQKSTLLDYFPKVSVTSSKAMKTPTDVKSAVSLSMQIDQAKSKIYVANEILHKLHIHSIRRGYYFSEFYAFLFLAFGKTFGGEE